MNKKIFILCVFCLSLFYNIQSKKYEPTWKSLDSRATPSWFENAKFGIFIHWGPYSVPAWTPTGTYSEWYQKWLQSKSLFGNGNFTGKEVYDFHAKKYGKNYSYYNFGQSLKAELFDAKEWASIFKNAGAKYIVFTSKHHDGFCWWKSKEANKSFGFAWNAMDIGPKRDILKELKTEVKKAKIKFGLYYSLYEWYNPLWLYDKEKFITEHFHPQFKDLIQTYEPDLIWPDGEWLLTDKEWKSKELLTWLFNESKVKDIITINDRWGKGNRFKHGGYFTAEYSAKTESSAKPWEECRGMGYSFGYNRDENLLTYSTPQTLVLLLVDIVSRGGNLLLDIGPKADGKIPVIMEERLLQIGEWLKVNGEAIYGTRKWERSCQWSATGNKNFKSDEHYLGADYILKQTVNPQKGYAVKELFFTKNRNTIYAISPIMPDKKLIIKNITLNTNSKISLLGLFNNLKWKQIGNNIEIYIPYISISKFNLKYAYSFKITNVKNNEKL